MKKFVLGLYRGLLLLLPPGLRREHGPEMTETVRRRLDRDGAGAATRELLDLAATIPREWVAAVGDRAGVDHHAKGGGGAMGGVAKDLRYGLRTLVRSPAFTMVAVLTLAVGIGVTTAIYTVVDSVLFRSLPFPEPDELVWVWGGPLDPVNRSARSWTSYPDYRDYVERERSFEELAAFRSPRVILSARGEAPTREPAARVTANLFSTVRVEAALGRTFTRQEDRIGGPPAVVLSHAVFSERFGEDPGLVGRSVTIDGTPHTVVGIMPPGFDFPEGARLWLPARPDVAGDDRGMHRLILVGRLRDEVDPEAAARDVYAIAESLAEAHPEDNADQGAWAEPLLEAYVGDVRATLLILLGSTGVVLFIACLNVANLFLARTATRGGEMGIRSAMGASRGRILRQLLLEGLMVAVAGGALGVGLAQVGLDAILALAPAGVLPRADEVSLDGRVLVVTAALTLGSVLLFALAPALRAAGRSVGELVKEGGRTGESGGGRLRSLLVIGETALAMALVVSGTLLLRSFGEVTEVEPGFEPGGRLILPVSLPVSRYPEAEWERVAEFVAELRRRTEAVPGVRSAGLTYAHPLDPSWTTGFHVVGRPEPDPAARPEASYRPVTPGYFETAGIRVLRGRDFTASDDGSSPPVVMVNEAFEERFFPEEGAVGRRIRKESWWEGTPRGEWEIVGVVEDVRFAGLERPTPPAFYFPHAQRPMNDMVLMAHVEGDPGPVVPGLRQAVREMDAGLPVQGVRAMKDILSETLARRRFVTVLLGAFGLTALILAGVGLYGVLSYSVSRRSREMGVRLSLGATRGGVVRTVVGQGVALVAVGVVLGLGLALASGRLLESLLFGVGSTDPLTLGGVAAVLLTVAVVASARPALRAARVDPAEALRLE